MEIKIGFKETDIKAYFGFVMSRLKSYIIVCFVLSVMLTIDAFADIYQGENRIVGFLKISMIILVSYALYLGVKKIYAMLHSMHFEKEYILFLENDIIEISMNGESKKLKISSFYRMRKKKNAYMLYTKTNNIFNNIYIPTDNIENIEELEKMAKRINFRNLGFMRVFWKIAFEAMIIFFLVYTLLNTIIKFFV